MSGQSRRTSSVSSASTFDWAELDDWANDRNERVPVAQMDRLTVTAPADIGFQGASRATLESHINGTWLLPMRAEVERRSRADPNSPESLTLWVCGHRDDSSRIFSDPATDPCHACSVQALLQGGSLAGETRLAARTRQLVAQDQARRNRPRTAPSILYICGHRDCPTAVPVDPVTHLCSLCHFQFINRYASSSPRATLPTSSEDFLLRYEAAQTLCIMAAHGDGEGRTAALTELQREVSEARRRMRDVVQQTEDQALDQYAHLWGLRNL